MQSSQRKTHLLQLMQTEHDTLITLLHSLSEEQMLRPQIAGNWSVKDILAHLTWWEQETISEIVHGIELDAGLQGEPWNTEKANTLMVEAQRLTPLTDVLTAFHNSYRQMYNVVEEMSEETLADKDLYIHLMDNTGNHYAEHRMAIETGLALES
ncbi:MAG: ClbS/DfsB family four-helix bundle protein [Ktedonobacteraceae bacterium]